MFLHNWFKNSKTNDIPAHIPTHVAIIMDGNGRWAKRRGMPRTMGHKVGLERVRDAVKVCREVGVKHLTLYAFSTENWRRPQVEVEFLMNLFQEAMQKEVDELNRNGVRLRFIGIRDGLCTSLLGMMEDGERITSGNDGLVLNIALNYGGRSELLNAVKQLVGSAKDGTICVEAIREEDISNQLFTAGQPDPDLLIKPGGEYRISNFLIWQLAYTEFYFTKTLWPDFGRKELLEAFREYSRRDRRFGRVKEV